MIRILILFALAVVPLPADPSVEALLARRVPELAGKIVFAGLPGGTPEGTFRLSHADGKVVVAGDSTNSRAAGLHRYLRHGCGMHFSWSGDQTAVPSPLPLPEEETVTSPWKWRSAHNHCVFSYSMAFWDWPRWERELDFLALNGVNQAFLLTGHEKVWENTLRRLGFDDGRIATWLPSTSHIAWWHFDNLQGEGGPLTRHEIDGEAALARKVADRMRELGIEPIALGFYGMVPDFFGTRFPGAKIIPQGNWVGGYRRPPVLDPSDPVFATTAEIYYEELEAVLGPVRHFGGDLFHEGGQTGGLDLATAFREVQDAMVAHRSDAVWVMFGWQANPRQEGLARLRPENAMIQQTSIHPGTAVPVSGSFRDYGGRIPWTWHLIDNFGGNHGLFGNFDTLATLPSRFLGGRVPGNFAGLGHSPEGIETNPVHAALFYDMFWRDRDVDVGEWLDAELARRYGAPGGPARRAWDLLARSSYRCPIRQEGISDYIFGARPRAGTARARTWAANDRYWCEMDVVAAWELLLEAAPALKGNANFRHDLADVTRHALNFHSKWVHDRMIEAFAARDRVEFDRRAEELLSLFDDLDAVLAADPNFLLGTWLERAKAKGGDAASSARIERNARNLITLWSGRNDELDDYASRSWAGLVGGHYKARWSRFVADLRGGWEGTGTPGYSGADLERAFLDDRGVFPVTPTGDVTSISAGIHGRLAPEMRRHASLRWSVPQDEAGEVILRFEVSGRHEAGREHRVSLSRQYGDAVVTLKRVALVAEDGGVLEEDETVGALGGMPEMRELEAVSVPEGRKVFLEIALESPGGRAVANGPVDFEPVFRPVRKDYIGRFQYRAGASICFRELREDGGLALNIDGADYGPWAGYTWRFVDGEAHLFKADGSLFERHRLSNRNTLLFQTEAHFGPARRIPLSSHYRTWATGSGMAAIADDPGGDPDGDGVPNLHEFLFGSDPHLADRQWAHEPEGEHLRLRWRRRSAHLLEAADYEMQVSPDLRDWRPWVGPETAVPSVLAGYVDVSVDLPTDGPSRFVRLKAGER